MTTSDQPHNPVRLASQLRFPEELVLIALLTTKPKYSRAAYREAIVSGFLIELFLEECLAEAYDRLESVGEESSRSDFAQRALTLFGNQNDVHWLVNHYGRKCENLASELLAERELITLKPKRTLFGRKYYDKQLTPVGSDLAAHIRNSYRSMLQAEVLAPPAEALFLENLMRVAESLAVFLEPGEPKQPVSSYREAKPAWREIVHLARGIDDLFFTLEVDRGKVDLSAG